jgi:hypothetical protein
MRAIDAPAALLRTANRVHTREEIQHFIEDLSAEALANAFAKLHNAGDTMFSAGMHALGYADVEIPFAIVPMESATDVAEEFLVFELINEMWRAESPIEFRSAVAGLSYQLDLFRCDRFDVPAEARFNSKGVWVFTQRLA